MAYTETKTTGYFSRIGNSFKGIFFGIVLIIGSVILLWWNEGRTIDVTQGLKEGQKITVNGNISPVDQSLEGKLIYINGKADTDEVLNDTTFLIKQNAIQLHRQVEMYQWNEEKKTETKENFGGSETTTTTYLYKKEWNNRAINSSGFKESGHNNPEDWIFESENKVAKSVKVGDIQLSDGFIHQINKADTIQIEQESYNLFMVQNKDINSKLIANTIYIGEGSPNSPKIGDLRINFSAVFPAEVSAIGKQEGNYLTHYTTKTDTKIQLLEYGMVGMENMYKQAHSDNRMMAWIFRGVGLVLMFIGFNMIFGVIVMIAKIIPFLSNIIAFGTGLIALVLTLLLGGGTIIIAWFFVRPFISIGIGIIVAAIIYMIYRSKKDKLQKKEESINKSI